MIKISVDLIEKNLLKKKNLYQSEWIDELVVFESGDFNQLNIEDFVSDKMEKLFDEYLVRRKLEEKEKKEQNQKEKFECLKKKFVEKK